jgi:ABC-type amino acid transport substrate-binding protein
MVFFMMTGGLLGFPSLAAEKILKLAMYTYPPLTFYQDGDWGFCYTLVKAIFEENGYIVKPRLYPVMRAIVHTEQKQADAICVINPFNSQKLALAKYPNARLTYDFWVTNDSTFRYEGIRSLKGIRVINVKGYNYTLPGKTYQHYLENQDNAKRIQVLSGADPLSRAFRIISIKRADTICLDEPSAVYTLTKMGMLSAFKKAGHLPNPLFGYFGVSKSHPQKDILLKIYNKGHVKQYQSGKMAAMLKEYNVKPWPLSDGNR